MKNNVVQTDSLGVFNFARGIGLLLVIYSHSYGYFYNAQLGGVPLSNIRANIGAGIMAMFFIIAGFGFYPRKTKRCWKTQTKLIIKPYVITAILVVCAKLFLAIIKHRSFAEYGGQLIWAYLLVVNKGWEGKLLGVGVDNIGMFWFFWSLFGGWMILNQICQLKNEKLKRILPYGAMLLGWLLTLISKTWILVLPNMLIVTGLLAIGYELRENEFFEKSKKISYELVLAIPALIMLLLGGVEMNYCIWNLGFLDVIGVSALGILFCQLFVALSQLNLHGMLYDFVSDIGFNTLWIF